jgi:hypothetical protein
MNVQPSLAVKEKRGSITASTPSPTTPSRTTGKNQPQNKPGKRLQHEGNKADNDHCKI